MAGVFGRLSQKGSSPPAAIAEWGETPVLGQYVTQHLVRRVGVRIERDRRPHGDLRLLGIAFQNQRLGEADPARGRARRAGGGAAIGLRRTLGVALALKEVAEPAMAVGAPGADAVSRMGHRRQAAIGGTLRSPRAACRLR